MLQGNPFETRLAVEEQTKIVQHGVKDQQRYRALEHRKILPRKWQELMPSVDLAAVSARSRQLAKDGWWLPAGIAIGILLRALLGG